jgi:hypothetical protein
MCLDNFTTGLYASYTIHRGPNTLIVTGNMYHFLGEILQVILIKSLLQLKCASL